MVYSVASIFCFVVFLLNAVSAKCRRGLYWSNTYPQHLGLSTDQYYLGLEAPLYTM